MSRGYPSLTALLGLLAIAGYQNRDKLTEMLRGAVPAAQGQGRRAWAQGRRAAWAACSAT